MKRLCLLLALAASMPMFADDLLSYPRHTLARVGHIERLYEGTAGQWLPISVQLGVDEDFSKEQKNIIFQAMQIFVERALQEHVINCAFSHAYKDLPGSKERFKAQLYDGLRPLLVGDATIPSFAFVARLSEYDNTVGLAYVGLFYDSDHPLPDHSGRHYFYVALNSDYLGPNASYRYRNDRDYWAGVLAHEYLHNLGYDHPSGYSGSFVKEYQRCLAGNGAAWERAEEFGDLAIFKEPHD